MILSKSLFTHCLASRNFIANATKHAQITSINYMNRAYHSTSLLPTKIHEASNSISTFVNFNESHLNPLFQWPSHTLCGDSFDHSAVYIITLRTEHRSTCVGRLTSRLIAIDLVPFTCDATKKGLSLAIHPSTLQGKAVSVLFALYSC
jgi:hypothetical protein